MRVWSPRGTGCFCVAGAALCASSGTFVWQAQHFDSLGVACARLVAAGDRLLLRGRRSTLCIWRYLCVAGAALCPPRGTGCFCVACAALCASGATFVWQAQHFDSLGVASSRLVAAVDRHEMSCLRGVGCLWVWGCGCVGVCVCVSLCEFSGCEICWQAQHCGGGLFICILL